MKKSELRQLIREEIGKVLKEEAAKEVILSNEILDFLEKVVNVPLTQLIQKKASFSLSSIVYKRNMVL